MFWVPLPGPSFRVLGMKSLAVHEAVPGHHFQLALLQEQAAAPRWQQRRIFSGGSANTEGWALYAEALAIEQGWYEGDDLSLLGALFGGPLGGVLMRYGRKRTLLAIALPFSLCWLLTVFASCVAMMYVTAFGCGFCSAVVLLVSHVYISEIASPEIRGGLCAVAKMTSQIGLLVSFSLGAYLDWRRLAMVATAAPVALFIAAFYVPETPSWLSLGGRDDQAGASLQWLRGEQTDVRAEWNTIQANVRRQQVGPRTLRGTEAPLWRQKRLVRPVLTTCGLMLFQRMSGAHAFSFYAVPIFRAAFSGMNPHGAAVVVAFVQLLASITSGLLVDTVGRLPLLITSNVLMTLALAAFGTFIYVQGGTLDALGNATGAAATTAADQLLTMAGRQVMDDSHNSDWIPLVCVLIFTVAFSIGVGPIAWLLISELYPLEFRGVGGAITTSFSYACAFVSVKTFVDFESSFGLHGAFWIYAVVSLFGLAFVLVFVPETRGRGLDEMESKSPSLKNPP